MNNFLLVETTDNRVVMFNPNQITTITSEDGVITVNLADDDFFEVDHFDSIQEFAKFINNGGTIEDD